MRLADLNPRWVCAGGDDITPRREGVGVSFDCPCGCRLPNGERERVYVALSQPLDGGSPWVSRALGPSGWTEQPSWDREGDSFEALTLRPSILRLGGCGWHGFVTKGEVSTV